MDRSDSLGFFYSEPEPQNFLTVQNVKEEKKDSVMYEIVLSDTRKITERSAFTILMLLGELGGLYGAIVGIPSIFISHFVQMQFMSAIAELMPVKREDD